MPVNRVAMVVKWAALAYVITFCALQISGGCVRKEDLNEQTKYLENLIVKSGRLFSVRFLN